MADPDPVAVITKVRVLGPEITPYREIGRKIYRWRWLAWLSSFPRFTAFKVGHQHFFMIRELEPHK
jgi:hypothetical protein